MPHVAVSDEPRPASGTTVSVVDGTVSPAPRPNTVISIGRTGYPAADPPCRDDQTGPAIVEVSAAGR